MIKKLATARNAIIDNPAPTTTKDCYLFKEASVPLFGRMDSTLLQRTTTKTPYTLRATKFNILSRASIISNLLQAYYYLLYTLLYL